MNINCEILDLRAFAAVVDLASFHRAADSLHISQPALSRRIQKLEETIGAVLLERSTRHVTTTAVGRELLPLVRRMLDEFDNSLFAFRSLGISRGGLVTIASIPTAAFYFLPEVIRRFNATHPQVRFRILDVPANEGLIAVERGEVEFGVNLMGASTAEVEFLPLVEDPFVLAVRKDNPLSEKHEITWTDLDGQPLITVHRASGNRTLLDAALGRANLRLSWKYEVTHLSTSLGFVEAGLGVSVLPRMATPTSDHPILVTRPIGGPKISRTIGLVRRRGGNLSPQAQLFFDMLAGEWGRSIEAENSATG